MAKKRKRWTFSAGEKGAKVKEHPVKDVAEAGGWASTETLVRCYQQPDSDTMLRVVLGAAELREKKAS